MATSRYDLKPQAPLSLLPGPLDHDIIHHLPFWRNLVFPSLKIYLRDHNTLVLFSGSSIYCRSISTKLLHPLFHDSAATVLSLVFINTSSYPSTFPPAMMSKVRAMSKISFSRDLLTHETRSPRSSLTATTPSSSRRSWLLRRALILPMRFSKRTS